MSVVAQQAAVGGLSTDERKARYHSAWTGMAKLLEQGDLAGFWEAYANHLRELGIHSQYRQLLLLAATGTANELKRYRNEPREN